MIANKRLMIHAPLQVMGASLTYAAALGWLERRFPQIKPDHIWVEVAGGVLITLVPVTLAAHAAASDEEVPEIDWQSYEHAVWWAFCAAGIPIILWQLGEAVLRRKDLLCYTTQRRSQPPAAAPSADNATSQPDRALALASSATGHVRNTQAGIHHMRDYLHTNPELAHIVAEETSQEATRALSHMEHLQRQIAVMLTALAKG